MPRTKVSKSSKRNREVTNREDKIREFENHLESYTNSLDENVQHKLQFFEAEIKYLYQRTSSALLKLNFSDVFKMDIKTLSNWEEQQKSKVLNASLHNSTNSTLMKSAKAINPNDEGYLTEDSSTGGSLGSSTGTITTTTTNAAFLSLANMRSQQQTARLRTPGPLNSAMARRPRRSRSACSEYVPGSVAKVKPQLSAKSGGGGGGGGQERNSRSKMRTPMASKTKALSADRTTKFGDANAPQSPPTFLRFPKPGELILSKCGSPLVTQTLPENFAHLNIPLRNGVISMRPRRLSNVQPHIIEDLDPETVDQLRTLKNNIDKLIQTDLNLTSF